MPPIYIYTLFSIITYIWIDYYIYGPYIMYVRRRFALPCSAVTLGVQLTIYIYHEYIYASNLYIHYSPLLYIYGSTIICMLYV